VEKNTTSGDNYANRSVSDDSRTVSCFIRDWRPTPLNKLINAPHWSVRSSLKAHDALIMLVAFKPLPKATGKRRVSIHVVLGKGIRSVDPDAYFKSTLDGLVKCGQLKDDSAKWCEFTTPTQVRAKKGEAWGTLITLEDLWHVTTA